MSTLSKTAGHLASSWLLAFSVAPATLVFLSSNIVNAGNLAFNVVFSRLMGPELFGTLALLLTVKLSVLGVTAALQMAVTEKVAATPPSEDNAMRQALSRANRDLTFVVILLILPLLVGLMFAGDLARHLNLPAPHFFLILMVGMPFGAALSVLRGLTFGRMDAGRIVASAQIEMFVRLGGALAAWQFGLGLEGVVAAISLSIIAGWAVLADLLPARPTGMGHEDTLKVLAFGALPFALLQLGQVLALDGEIFLARAILPDDEAGHIAALSLFQRIQFFACFALASVLLPGVLIAARSGESILRTALPVAGLFALVSGPVLVAAALWPGLLIRLLVGPEYVAAAPALFSAVAAAALFTGSYLIATFLAALRDRRGILVVFATALFQLALMSLLQPSTLHDLIEIKLLCQLATAIVLLFLSVSHIRQHRAS